MAVKLTAMDQLRKTVAQYPDARYFFVFFVEKKRVCMNVAVHVLSCTGAGYSQICIIYANLYDMRVVYSILYVCLSVVVYVSFGVCVLMCVLMCVLWCMCPYVCLDGFLGVCIRICVSICAKVLYFDVFLSHEQVFAWLSGYMRQGCNVERDVESAICHIILCVHVSYVTSSYVCICIQAEGRVRPK